MRPPPFLRVGALALLVALLAPTAAAAITLGEVALPERTRAEKPFPVRVEVSNDGSEDRSIHLFGALYRGEGASPCGPSTDGRFQAFTHLVNERVDVPAGATIVYPEEGEWLHRYAREHAPPGPESAELCIFAANATKAPATSTIQYEAYATTPISIRGENAPPSATFTWTPERPRATADVVFTAQATDPEGDPVEFRWDFGVIHASGRAKGDGMRATTFFYPAGDYEVTLVASDGLDEARVSRSVSVLAADAPPDRPWEIPAPGAWSIVAIALLAIVRRRS